MEALINLKETLYFVNQKINSVLMDQTFRWFSSHQGKATTQSLGDFLDLLELYIGTALKTWTIYQVLVIKYLATAMQI